MYVQGPVFGRRAERMMKVSSIEWSDNSEDEYTISVEYIICAICKINLIYGLYFQEGSRSIDMSDISKSLPTISVMYVYGIS